NYNGAYCIESFDPRCITWLRKNRPQVIRGQLTENFFRSKSNLPWLLKFAMRHQLLNVFTRPDFVAYRFADRKTLSNFICRKIWGVQGVTWTIRSKEDFDTAVSEDWLPIFENFIP
ncbi:MAG: glycerophosphodiester phosphodiesterase, partial [Oscillospiraceae bacterium]|nr:glycerophosphodiester phosphodiesterase [Oscillospiraceae bacterium]